MEKNKKDKAIYDNAAIRSLFEKYFRPLVVFAENYVREPGIGQDIVQDVFLFLVESGRTFESERHLKAYLYLAVKNRCLKNIRNTEIRQRHALSYSKELESDQFYRDQVIEEEVMSVLVEQINALPPYYRNVFLLTLQGKKNPEISEELGITVETVKSYKKEGKALLRERLRKLIPPSALKLLLVLLGI